MADEGDEVPGRPQAIEMPGHTRGTVAYRCPVLCVQFTGDALVTRKT
ncbi:MBL fold metallo-hydrolase [Streptomyces violascens]